MDKAPAKTASGKSAKKSVPKSTLDFLNDMKGEPEAGGGTPIPLDDIDPDLKQPRSSFRPVDGKIAAEIVEKLQELADDIASNSLLQPIILRQEANGRYTIIAGERRWRAFLLNRQAGVPNSDRITAIIRQDLSPEKLRLSQLSENLQRDDLTDIEVANFIKETLEEFPNLKKKDVGQIVKKNSQYVSRILALLDPQWSDVVNTGIIPFASLLEQYRPLPDAQKAELKELATRENRALTSGDIRAAKARGEEQEAAAAGTPNSAAPTVPRPAGPPAIDEELANQISSFIEESAPKGETYTPPANAASPARLKLQIKDVGGDAVIPPGTAALNPAMMGKRELRLTLQQLETLLARGGLHNKAHQVSIMLPVDELKESLASVGGVPPEDDAHLVMKLLETINQL